ncbi:hypothetical protein WMY93_007784 [Mugilogobius chulae]|uniref:L1 transposable element RRM domain-containing protein n=1 Tax=Mugilogobius chulae TaxID=88201 RepID=A0AAW0PE24_9GOBI
MPGSRGRSKRQNLRIAGITRLGYKPLLDRAHRSLRSRQDDNAPPRHIVLRVHYGHEFEEITRRISQNSKLSYDGQQITIFRDYPSEVVKQRSQFAAVRGILRGIPGVRFGLKYPAKLRVTYNGLERTFTDHKEARKYAENIADTTKDKGL